MNIGNLNFNERKYVTRYIKDIYLEQPEESDLLENCYFFTASSYGIAQMDSKVEIHIMAAGSLCVN